jgi:hypothetical protein
MNTRTLALVAVLSSLCACSNDGDNLSGTKKAAPPAASAPPVVNPHAAPGGDPHAGIPGAPPLTQAPAAPSAAVPVTWTAPAGWTETKSTRQMRVVEFDAGKDADGNAVQCVVYNAIGGSDEENIARWIGMMGPDAKAGAKVTHSEKDGVKFTRLEAHGPYTDTMGMSGGSKEIPAATMLAAIVESGGAKIFVKMVGASKLLDDGGAGAKFDALLASMKAK